MHSWKPFTSEEGGANCRGLRERAEMGGSQFRLSLPRRLKRRIEALVQNLSFSFNFKLQF